MVKKQIIWSEKAEEELISTLINFYNERNQSTVYSEQFLDKLEKYLDYLSRHNYLGQLTEDKETRVVIIDSFLVFYLVGGVYIEIVSFFHSKQNPAKNIISRK